MKRKSSHSPDASYDTYQCPLGMLYLIFSEKTLTGISFEKPEASLPLRRESRPVKEQLEVYFKGRPLQFDLDFRFVEGTEFERAVWLCLKEIPFGETRTYRWVAERIGRPRAVRAVGQALGKNPLPIIFPCHRVIESDGSLGGYSGGIDIKRRLLDLEYYATRSRGGNTECSG